MSDAVPKLKRTRIFQFCGQPRSLLLDEPDEPMERGSLTKSIFVLYNHKTVGGASNMDDILWAAA